MNLHPFKNGQNIGLFTPEQGYQKTTDAPRLGEKGSFQAISDIAVPIKEARLVKRRSSLRRGLVLYIACSLGAQVSSSAQAQNLKPAEQAKVRTLKSRLEKAASAGEDAEAVLRTYRVFRVVGKVGAGDNRLADIYGTASQIAGAKGAGSISDDNYLYVTSPVDEHYDGGRYRGECLFLGVMRGRNAYLPVERDPKYMAAYTTSQKYHAIEVSIQAEIDAIYLPYQKIAKNEAAAIAANQSRVDQAHEQLNKEKRELEQTKAARVSKQEADAEIARLAGSPVEREIK